MYVITFERKMFVDHKYQWISEYKVFDAISDVKEFLEYEYSAYEGCIANVTIYRVSDVVPYTKTITITIGKE